MSDYQLAKEVLILQSAVNDLNARLTAIEKLIEQDLPEPPAPQQPEQPQKPKIGVKAK